MTAVLGRPPIVRIDEIEALLEEIHDGAPHHEWHRMPLPRDLRQPVSVLRGRLTDLRKAQRAARKAVSDPSPHVQRLLRMNTVLGDISSWLTESFMKVTKATHVDQISALVGQSGPVSIDLEVRLKTGVVGTPQQLFSEGYQDLIAALFFLAVARAGGRQGVAKILILDDVLQSIDATVRVQLMNLVAHEFKDWQLLITVHDQLWRNQLRNLLSSAAHPYREVDIRAWSFDRGPQFAASASGGGTPFAALSAALIGGDPATICGATGRCLEQVSDRMSWTLPVKVTRRQGDRYTLGDLWPGVSKHLRRTNISETVSEVDTWVHLRNLVGAHYNEWADALSRTEADQFAHAVLALVERLHCPRCSDWVARSGLNLTCRCGERQVEATSR